jgi:putative flippase GtrA
MGVNNLKFFLHTVFIILIALVTFFGLGPVLFADGVLQERLWTAAIVVVIYIILAFLYRKAIQWANRR